MDLFKKKETNNYQIKDKNIKAIENEENLFFFTNILKKIEHFIFFWNFTWNCQR